MTRAPRWGLARLLVALVALVALAGCGRDGSSGAPPGRPSATVSSQAAADRVEPGEPPFPTRLPGAQRIVAVGDLHGDLAAARAALRLAELIDADDHWTGGDAVLVQTGDVFDRGDDEREIHELLTRLGAEARERGGAVHLLNGNHELMNVLGDFRYVSPGGFADFAEADEPGLRDPALGRLPFEERGRAAAFRPGGGWARKLASQPVVLVVGDTLFAHGSVVPEHVEQGLERLNQQSRAWLEGRSKRGQRVAGRDSPVWLRTFGGAEGRLGGLDATDCALLERTLELARAARLVVGHTIQSAGPSSACGGRVWRIDVGMGTVPDAAPRALEIVGPSVRVLEPSADATGADGAPSATAAAAR